MSLPNFLAPSTPPRSPHVAEPSFFDSYFTQPTPTRSHWVLRPTRRDVLLCLLTLSFSYLLFSAPPQVSTTTIVTGPISTDNAPSKYKIGWSSLFHSSSESCSSSSSGDASTSREMSFTESIKTYGVVDDGLPVQDVKWDGGEDENEDDQLVQGETSLIGHQPGWTFFDKLYVYNGSFYAVTHDPTIFPELRMMTSTGLPAVNEPGNIEAREPKGDEILYITPSQAAQLWGDRVYRMEGTTWLFNDGQFLDHYYHFAAELLLGTWRTNAALDQDITPQGSTKLTPPRRIWFLHQNVTEWRDKPRFNPTILFSLFPSTAVLYPDDMKDLANSTRSFLPNAFVLDRALLADRSAAFRGEWTGPTARTVASALRVGTTSRWWWEPLRRQVLRYSGVEEAILDRNLEGLGAVDPATLDNRHLAGPGIADLEPLAPAGSYKPLVTYISRQNSRRRLTAESHKELVDALTERAAKVGFDFVVVEAEKLTKEEQFALAAKTTIMLGVHGNGLTHLLWMPATPRSAVIEMFFTGGFARDYQWTAHALGIRHFAVQHDVTFTSPNLPQVAYPEGFQGTSITVKGQVVADLIEDRLAGKA